MVKLHISYKIFISAKNGRYLEEIPPKLYVLGDMVFIYNFLTLIIRRVLISRSIFINNYALFHQI